MEFLGEVQTKITGWTRNLNRRNHVLSRQDFCRYPRVIFPIKVPGEFTGGFFSGFFRTFALGKKEEKNPPKNIQQNSKQKLGASQPKSTLQGSGLHVLQALKAGTEPSENNCIKTQRKSFLKDPSEPKTRTSETIPHPNRCFFAYNGKLPAYS